MLILRSAFAVVGVHYLRLRSRVPFEVCNILSTAAGPVNGKTLGRKTTNANELDCQEVRIDGKRCHGAVRLAKIHIAGNQSGKDTVAGVHLLPGGKSPADYGSGLVLGAGQRLGDQENCSAVILYFTSFHINEAEGPRGILVVLW